MIPSECNWRPYSIDADPTLTQEKYKSPTSIFDSQHSATNVISTLAFAHAVGVSIVAAGKQNPTWRRIIVHIRIKTLHRWIKERV